MQEELADIRSQITLCRAAIERAKRNINFAHNDYLADVQPKMKEMRKRLYRQHISDCLGMIKKLEALAELKEEGERWELYSGVFSCHVPWVCNPGPASDPVSGLQMFFHRLVEENFITEAERINMLHGGEFQP